MNTLQNYSRFVADNPRLDFSFLYPSEWQAQEIKGKEYDEVFVRGPRNRENTYSLSLVVRVATGEMQVDLETLTENHLAQNKRLSKFREISRIGGALAGVEAAEIEIGYTMLLPVNTVNPKETSILERTIFLKRSNQLYEIAYKAVEGDYYKYLEAFRNAARTFEFREESPQQVNWPVVTPTPAHAVHEPPVEYKTRPTEE